MQNSILVYSQAKVKKGIPDAVQSDRLAFMLEMTQNNGRQWESRMGTDDK
jgi:hypothetical protein